MTLSTINNNGCESRVFIKQSSSVLRSTALDVGSVVVLKLHHYPSESCFSRLFWTVFQVINSLSISKQFFAHGLNKGVWSPQRDTIICLETELAVKTKRVCACVCVEAIYIVRYCGGVIDSSNGTNLFRDHRDLSSRLEVEGYYCGFVRIKLKMFPFLNLTSRSHSRKTVDYFRVSFIISILPSSDAYSSRM